MLCICTFCAISACSEVILISHLLEARERGRTRRRKKKICYGLSNKRVVCSYATNKAACLILNELCEHLKKIIYRSLPMKAY